MTRNVEGPTTNCRQLKRQYHQATVCLKNIRAADQAVLNIALHFQ